MIALFWTQVEQMEEENLYSEFRETSQEFEDMITIRVWKFMKFTWGKRKF